MAAAVLHDGAVATPEVVIVPPRVAAPVVVAEVGDAEVAPAGVAPAVALAVGGCPTRRWVAVVARVDEVADAA